MSPSRRSYEPGRRRSPIELRGIRVALAPDPFARPTPYRRGECRYLYVIAEADVAIEEIQQVLTSAGLYGIDSSAPDETLEEFASQEWIALRKVLTAVGVPTAELPLEVDRAWIEWRM